jgi:hypothetical protein
LIIKKILENVQIASNTSNPLIVVLVDVLSSMGLGVERGRDAAEVGW